MMVTTDTTFEKQNGEKENAQNGGDTLLNINHSLLFKNTLNIH